MDHQLARLGDRGRSTMAVIPKLMKPVVPFIIVAALLLLLQSTSRSETVWVACMPMLVCVFLLVRPKSVLHFTLSFVGFLAFFWRPIWDVTVARAGSVSDGQLYDLVVLSSCLTVSTFVTICFCAVSKPSLTVGGQNLKAPSVRIWHLLFATTVFSITFALITHVSFSTYKEHIPRYKHAVILLGEPVALCAALSIVINSAILALRARRRIVLAGVSLAVVCAVGCFNLLLYQFSRVTYGFGVDGDIGVREFRSCWAPPIFGVALAMVFIVSVALAGFITEGKPGDARESPS